MVSLGVDVNVSHAKTQLTSTINPTERSPRSTVRNDEEVDEDGHGIRSRSDRSSRGGV